MFDLDKNVLIQMGKESPIVKWEVLFLTPKGVASDLYTAITFCKYNDWDVNLVIQPVPVATDKLGRCEIIERTKNAKS